MPPDVINPYKAPFYGKGIAFPVRIDPIMGGFLVTEGSADQETVGMEYVPERQSIREPIPERPNHIAESCEHILLVTPGEHDTLPEFGSHLFAIIFDPNNWYTEKEYEVWVQLATARWEKRAYVPDQNVKWATTDYERNQGISAVRIGPEVIDGQVPGNLVSPFVTPRQARAQEYSLGTVDENGHDSASRYHGQKAYNQNGVRFIRPRRVLPMPQRHDDIFYRVAHGDTWLLISWKHYQDIRYWWVIGDMAVQDAAAAGKSRDEGMDITGDPEPGTLLRLPSRTRLLMEIAA